MAYYPSVPVRDPRAGTSGERTARILCCVITALAVLVCLPFLVTTQTSTSQGSDAPPTPSGPTKAQFLAAFPTPSGAVRVSSSGDRRQYRVPGTLATVKSFYVQRLPGQQVAWLHLAPDYSYVGVKQVTTGWTGDLYGNRGVTDFGLQLTLVDGNFASRAPGSVSVLVAPR